MGKKRIQVKKIREILRLNTLDLSDRKIARALRVSRPFVADKIQRLQESGKTYELIKDIPDSELMALLNNKENSKLEKTRYKELSQYFQYISSELKRTGVTLGLLWNEYKEKHADGYKYSQFCYHYQMWKKMCDLIMHIDHKAGDKMFVDYAGDRLCIYDRESEEAQPVETFVAVLGGSGLTYVETSESQEKDNWISSNENAILYFGGVTAAIVPDNLRSAVSKSDPYEPGINPDFDDFAEHYGTVIIPARVRKARDKALVENAVNIVYMRIYAPLRNKKFYSIEELNEAIKELLEIHNNTHFQRLDYSRRQLFERVEKEALKPLPAQKYPRKTTKIVTAGINYHVELREDKHYYSFPHYIKKKNVKVSVKLVYNERIVAIYYDNVRIAQHLRDRTPNGYTTVPEHMPSHHRIYSEWDKERILRWSQKYGETAKHVVEKIFATRKHPEQAYKACLGLLNLPKKYGEKAFEQVCLKACKYNVYSIKRITEMLKVIVENEKQPKLSFEIQIPEHENIRGSEYYN